MVRSPTETGGGVRDAELRKSELALREDAAAERQPIGSTDEDVRCVAFTIRRHPSLPVPPGCDIWVACIAMPRSMPNLASVGRQKMQPYRVRFFGFRLSPPKPLVKSIRTPRSNLEHPGISTTESLYVSILPPYIRGRGP